MPPRDRTSNRPRSDCIFAPLMTVLAGKSQRGEAVEVVEVFCAVSWAVSSVSSLKRSLEEMHVFTGPPCDSWWDEQPLWSSFVYTLHPHAHEFIRHMQDPSTHVDASLSTRARRRARVSELKQTRRKIALFFFPEKRKR